MFLFLITESAKGGASQSASNIEICLLSRPGTCVSGAALHPVGLLQWILFPNVSDQALPVGLEYCHF